MENIMKIREDFQKYWQDQYDEGARQARAGVIEYQGRTWAGWYGFYDAIQDVAKTSANRK